MMAAAAAAAAAAARPAARPALTHFLCIPLATAAARPQLSESLASFRADVTGPLSSFGVPADAVRPVGTLHLTLGVMSFPRGEGLEQAVALLRSLRPREVWTSLAAGPKGDGEGNEKGKGEETGEMEEEAEAEAEVEAEDAEEEDGEGGARLSDPPTSSSPSETTSNAAPASAAAGPPHSGPLITLRGLRSMQQQASASSVLYAPPADRDGALQRFCEALRDPFLGAGLLVPDSRPLLLHATIVNTVYARDTGKKTKGGGGRGGKGGKGGKGRGRGGRLTLDARGILGLYGDWVWMEGVRAEKLAICRMGAKKVEVDGDVVDEAYEVEAEIDL